jgi:hypothetical protein
MLMNPLDGCRHRPFRKNWGTGLVRMGLALLILLAPAAGAFAWGPTAHRTVNSLAVDTLPLEIRYFFEANRQFLAEHANDPDQWMQQDPYERKRHYLYLDKYGMFPYLGLPHGFKQATEKFGSRRINRDGLLPWHVGEFSLRLTNALKAQKWDEAKLAAAALGHYVADTRNPLHTTSNYDGQVTLQAGLAERFGSALIDRFQGFIMFRPAPAMKVDDPTEYAFEATLESNSWVNQIILADRRAVDGLRDYNDDYYDRFYAAIGHIAARELNNAARDTGSYWYTAWLNAGRPQLPGR